MAKKTGASKRTISGKREKKVELNQVLTEIEKRAYEIYEKRTSNSSEGDNLSDWVLAENEIKMKHKIK